MASETELERIIIRLVGDGSEYSKMMTEAAAHSKETAHQVEESARKIEGFREGLNRFAESAVRVVEAAGVVEWLREAFGGFVKAESGMLRLTAAIESNGRAAGPAIEDYTKFAKEMAEVTTISKGTTLAMLQQAETFGFSGSAAKEVISNAVALTGVLGGEAAEHIRVAIALKQGHVEHLRMLPTLRFLKTDAEVLTEANRLLANGWKVVKAEAESMGAQLTHLHHEVEAITHQFGKTVAEGIKPVVAQLREASKWVSHLSEDSKKLIVATAAVSAGLLLIGPALAVMRLALGPVTSLFGLLASTVAVLVSPIGLVVSGITAAAAATLYWTGAGGAALDWFSDRWAGLLGYIQPAIDGIKDALAGGDIELAMKIAWKQIQITFLEGTQTLREYWIDFTAFFKQAWADATMGVNTLWEKTSIGLAHLIAELGDKINKALGNTSIDIKLMHSLIEADSTAAMDKIEAEHRAALERAKADAVISMQTARVGLQVLKNEQVNLIKKAAEAAEEAAKDVHKPDFPTGIGDHFKKANEEIHRFNAALSGSNEALSRISEFQDAVRFGTDPHGKAAVADRAPKVDVFDRTAERELLASIKDILQKQLDADIKDTGIQVAIAGLGGATN